MATVAIELSRLGDLQNTHQNQVKQLIHGVVFRKICRKSYVFVATSIGETQQNVPSNSSGKECHFQVNRAHQSHQYLSV